MEELKDYLKSRIENIEKEIKAGKYKFKIRRLKCLMKMQACIGIE